MRRTLTILAVVASLTGAGSAFAAQTKAPAAPAAPAAKAHTVSGTVTAYDAATHMLTLSTPKGEEHFALAPSATFHEGQKAIAASDLSNLTGRRAEVRYTESGGMKTAERITVSAAAPVKGAKAAPTSGTQAPSPEPNSGKKY